MRDHAREALELVRGRIREDLDRDRILCLAVVRLIEIIGEAANRIPKTERERIREVPWAELIGLRNRLIHGYDDVDLDILWQILRKDLPSLVQALDRQSPGPAP